MRIESSHVICYGDFDKNHSDLKGESAPDAYSIR